MREPEDRLHLVAADGEGNIFDLSDYHAGGMSGGAVQPLRRPECIPLPEGSELFLLPRRAPLGFEAESGDPVQIGDGEVFAVAAFLAPAHTQHLTSAYEILPEAPGLPLFAYTAVGWHRGRFFVPACRIDPDRRQDIGEFSTEELAMRAILLKERFGKNRLWQHLLDCALCSGCPAARNLVLGRWEAPLPTSRSCNAECLGCLSLQPPESSCPATQERIAFRPSVEEIVEIAVPHLEEAPRAVVSFGQGCEGEPLTETDLLEEAIGEIRRRTPKGTVNVNTNASRPGEIERLFAAGLDSIRVSLNSAREKVYDAYFRPRGYGLDDVRESLRVARRRGRFASINYFVFPGVTDDPDEVSAFTELLKATRPDFIQWRNLNLDPDLYWNAVADFSSGQAIGVPKVMERLRKRFPKLRYGYYNPPLRGSRAYGKKGGANRKRAR